MSKNLKTISAIIFLLSTSNSYALSNCPGATPYTWNNCTGSHTLMNGMYWKGEYQRGGPNGSGELSYDGGGIEGIITSQFGIVTGIKGYMYGLSKGTKIPLMDADLDMDEIDGGTGVAQGIFYFPDATINGFMIPDAEGNAKYVGRVTLTDGRGGYVIADYSAMNEISEEKYQNLEARYIKEIYSYRKARGAELKNIYSNKWRTGKKSPDFSKKHSKALANMKALRYNYLKNGDKTKPLFYNSDIYIKKFQAIQ